jgi:hypothetical protein
MESVLKIRQAFFLNKQKLPDFERKLRAVTIARYEIGFVKRICAKILTPLSDEEIKDLGISQLDLRDVSSANSTPIDCKSMKSTTMASLNNSNLKKRTFSELKEDTPLEESPKKE